MHHFRTFGEQSFYNFPKILFADSPIFSDFCSDKLMIEISYFIINCFIKSFDLVGQVLLSSLTNTGSSRKFSLVSFLSEIYLLISFVYVCLSGISLFGKEFM